jgi:hypothetical protein
VRRPVSGRSPLYFRNTFGPARMPWGQVALLLSTSLLLLASGAVAEGRHTNVITLEAVKWMETRPSPKAFRSPHSLAIRRRSGETVVQRIKFPPKMPMKSEQTSGRDEPACTTRFTFVRPGLGHLSCHQKNIQ